MRIGLECWNRPDAGTPEERAKVIALRPSVIKIRGYHPLSIVDWALTVNPDMLFLVRPDVDGALVTPEHTLAYIHSRGARCIYIADSEPNHLDSGWRKHGFPAYWLALELAAENALATMPHVSICWPPMAVQQDDLQWLADLAIETALWPKTYQGCHLYWQYSNHLSLAWGRRIGSYAAIAPGRRWIVDELGDSTPNKPASERADAIINVLGYLHSRGDVDVTCLFLAAGGTPEWSRYFLPIEECRRIGNYAASLKGGDVVVDDKVRMYQAWAKARIDAGQEPRDVAAFVEHLKALGCDYTAPHLYGLPFVQILPKVG